MATKMDGTGFSAVNRNALKNALESILDGESADVEEFSDQILAYLEKTGNQEILNGLAQIPEGEEPAVPTQSWLRKVLSDSTLLEKIDKSTEGQTRLGLEESTNISQWDADDEPDPPLSPNAQAILEKRYLARNEEGEPIEDSKGLFLRVARAIAQGESNFTDDTDVINDWTKKFYRMIASLKFLPNSPSLVNAGKDNKGSLSACFVVSPEDNMESIMKVAHDAAMIEKWGGGIGFGFSDLRPKGEPIATTHGAACGPIAVMKLYSAVGATLTQGSFRLGAHMGQLSVSHPDIMEFIHAKDDDTSLQNFNISVQVTDDFMKAVQNDEEWKLINPKTNAVQNTINARDLWKDIAESAWKTGDPGLVFIDRVLETQPSPQLGAIKTSNPCGEEFLENYGNCCLGSIDLAKHVASNGEFDWVSLEETVRLAVRFLDDVIEVNTFPLPELREMNLQTRRIGLGIMGWADALVQFAIPYNSDAALDLGRKVGSFIRETAWSESENLAKSRGEFPAYEGSRLQEMGMPPVRHSSVTTIAPTGTISRLADTSSGIEPHFALSWWSNILWEDHEGTSTRFLDSPGPIRNALIKEVGEEQADTVLRQLADDPTWVDESVKMIIDKHGVRTAMAIDPSWHVKMQAAWQDNTTNSVSKTINLPNKATVEDIAKSFWLSWESGLKATTVYRDGSKSMQVLETGKTSKDTDSKETPENRTPRVRPTTLPAVTDRIRTGHGNLYVTITFNEEGRPFEVFTNLGKAGSSDAAYLEAVSRMASLALRSGVDVSQVVDQLRGITDLPTWDKGQQVLSAPDAVALALIRHAVPEDDERKELARRARKAFSDKIGTETGESEDISYVEQPRLFPKPEEQSQNKNTSNTPSCPDCYGGLVFTEGCLMCFACGYSKC
jgi:ribonucleoside-diphosphate reductase alpha chain